MKLKKTGSPITFCLDIGGTGIKGFTADAADRPTCERVRVETPHPATPRAMLEVMGEIARQMPPPARQKCLCPTRSSTRRP